MGPVLRDPGPRDLPQSLKVGLAPLPKSGKVGAQDHFRSLKVGVPHLSLMNSFFVEYFIVFLLIHFCVFF